MVGKITRRRLIRDVARGGSYLAVASPFVIVRDACAAEPIRVAVVQDMSKATRLLGELHVKGLDLAFGSVGNEIIGRKIDLVVEDLQGDPAIALSKTKKVLATFKPHFFVGPIGSAEDAAIKDTATKANTIWLILTQGAGAEDTVLPICSRNAFSVSWNNWQLSAPFAKWAYSNIAKEFWLAYENYNWGQGAGAVFKELFEQAGGKILGSIAPPIGTTDFAPYLTKILSAKPPAVFCFFAGGDAVNFVKQWHQFGLNQTTEADRPRLHGRRRGFAGRRGCGARHNHCFELGSHLGYSRQQAVSRTFQGQIQLGPCSVCSNCVRCRPSHHQRRFNSQKH